MEINSIDSFNALHLSDFIIMCNQGYRRAYKLKVGFMLHYTVEMAILLTLAVIQLTAFSGVLSRMFYKFRLVLKRLVSV